MTQHTAPEDLGAPVSYLVLEDGTAVYDRSGAEVGTVDHVLADEHTNLFHGLLVKTADGHRYAAGDQVDGIFEHGVIVAEPADRLATPSADATAEPAGDHATGLRRAWEWLIQPK
ncbi:PRC-barrel domain-containing protein [Actinoplanes sp. CA-252034]|uniref:PRC-barrel domain-containing protein n=1 Tax=Actinoplanes sp. CA-252034 TaxID=3239906 RepID=UPI003D99AE95